MARGSSGHLCFETGARTTRAVLPSRVRRGRMSTTPVWRVTLVSGDVWEFQRRKDALRFANAGGCPDGVERGMCWACRGRALKGGG